MHAKETTPDLAALWRSARAMLGFLRAAFAQSARRAAAEWLVPLEHLLRKLLLIEALALKPRATTAPSAFQLLMRRMALARAEPERPRRFLFRFGLAPAPITGPRIRDCGPAHTLARTAPVLAASAALRATPAEDLARRIGAIAQVLADPAPHARRLARRLRRLGAARTRCALTLARAGGDARLECARELGLARSLALKAAHAIDSG